VTSHEYSNDQFVSETEKINKQTKTDKYSFRNIDISEKKKLFIITNYK